MRPWQIIFRKEFWEVFRDGRTRFNLILSPLLLTPLILAIIGGMARKEADQSRKEVVSAAVVGLEKAPRLRELLKDADKELGVSALQAAAVRGKLTEDTNARVRLVEMTRGEAEKAIRARKVRAAALIPEDADERLAQAAPVYVTLLVDEGSRSSQEGAARLDRLFRMRGKQVVAERLAESGLSMATINPFTIREEPIPGGKVSAGTQFFVSFLPYVLAISAIMGGIYIANDSVAGEKERGTLETLLVSPAPRREVALGKFLAVAAVSLVSSLLSIVGLIWPFYVKLPVFAWMSESGLTLRPAAIAAMILVQIPLALLGAGLLLSISTFARNQKEAQTYLAPVLLGGTVAAMMTLFLKAETPLVWAFMPITNAAMVLKQALEGVTNLPFVAVACVTSILYAAAAVVFATRSFQKESILLKA